MRNFVAASFLCFVLVPAALAQVPDLYDMDTVRDIKLTFQQSNWWTQLRNNKSSRAEIKADMVVDNVTYKDVGVRFRGNTSYSYNVGRSEKLPFNIRTDAFVSGQKLYGYDNLNLINAHRDATFIREPVSYLMMRRHFPAMKSNWVKLWLNNVYWGIYVNTEQPGKDFARDSFDDEDGNLYRGDSPSRLTRPTLTYLGSNIASYQGQYDYYTNNHPLPWVDLVNLCFVLDRTPMAQLPARLPQVLNVDRALWYLAVQNILSNTDSYIGVGNDYLAYHDETHGRFSILPWDLNTTFGAYDLIRKPLDPQWLKRMDPFSDGGEPWLSLRRPLMTRLWGVPQWRERYLAHFRAMLDDWFDWSVVGPILTKYHKMLDPHVRADTKKLYALQSFYDNLTTDVVVRDRYGSYRIPGLKSFVDTKRAFLQTHAAVNRVAPTVTELKHTPPLPKATDTVWITARMSTNAAKTILYWRFTGAFIEAPMFDDGKHGDGGPNDGVWGAGIAPQSAGRTIQYYVSGETTAGVLTFAPRRATGALSSYRILFKTGTSPVRLNELLAKNTKGAKDEHAEFEDWIELVNTGKQDIDVRGMFLTDKFANPTKWQFWTGTKIKAGGTLLCWADEDRLQGPLHLNFKLSITGEEVSLFDKDGKTLLDTIKFGPQLSDVSTGRLFDGKTTVGWVTFPVPTANAPNAPATCGVRVYSAADPLAHTLRFSVTGAPKVSSTVQCRWQNGPANGALVHVFSASAANTPVAPTFAALVGAPFALFVMPLDAQGAATLPLAIPDIPALVGLRLYMQALGVSPAGLLGSNAAEMTFCPK